LNVQRWAFDVILPYNMPPPDPKGSHLPYWRKSPRPSKQAPPAPLAPLSTRQSVGLIVVATLIAALVVMSVTWWIRDVHH